MDLQREVKWMWLVTCDRELDWMVNRMGFEDVCVVVEDMDYEVS